MQKEYIFLSISILVSAIILSVSFIFSGGKINPEEFDELLLGYEGRQILKEKGEEILSIKKDDYILGNPNAEITIFEYSDFECPYCKRFYTETAKIVENFDGKVNLVYRHFPGLHQPLSVYQANAVECAGEQKGSEIFFQFHDKIYEATNSNGRSLIYSENKDASGRQFGMDIKEIEKIAQSLNLDMDQFSKCQNSLKYQDKINNVAQEGSEIGVSGTPNAFIINNKKGKLEKINGYTPYAILEEKVENLLK